MQCQQEERENRVIGLSTSSGRRHVYANSQREDMPSQHLEIHTFMLALLLVIGAGLLQPQLQPPGLILWDSLLGWRLEQFHMIVVATATLPSLCRRTRFTCRVPAATATIGTPHDNSRRNATLQRIMARSAQLSCLFLISICSLMPSRS